MDLRTNSYHDRELHDNGEFNSRSSFLPRLALGQRDYYFSNGFFRFGAFVLAFSFSALVPNFSLAANHVYVCPNFTGGGNNVSCSGDDVVFAASGFNSLQTPTPDPYITWTGITYYVVVTTTGTTGDFRVGEVDNSGFNLSGYISNTGTYLHESFVSGIGIGPTFVYWAGTATTDAHITYLCISDVSYADCTPGGGGGGPPAEITYYYDTFSILFTELMLLIFTLFMFFVCLWIVVWMVGRPAKILVRTIFDVFRS